MARHKRKRIIAALPKMTSITVSGGSGMIHESMTLEEYEAIRLIDHVGLTQSGAAKQMGVARTTVQAIYFAARGKIAALLVSGGTMKIEGGDYIVAESLTEHSDMQML